MSKEPDWIEPENQTECEVSGDKHDWEWDEERDDWYCLLCGVWHNQQE